MSKLPNHGMYLFNKIKDKSMDKFSIFERTTQLRESIKEYSYKQRVERLHESLHKDIIRTSKLDANRGYAQTFSIKGTTHELQLIEGVHVELQDSTQKQTIQATILNTKFEAFFPNAHSPPQDTEDIRPGIRGGVEIIHFLFRACCR